MQGLWLTVLLQLAVSAQGQPYYVQNTYKEESCETIKQARAMPFSIMAMFMPSSMMECTKVEDSTSYSKMIANSSGCFWEMYSDSACATVTYSNYTMQLDPDECNKKEKTYCTKDLPEGVTLIDCLTADTIKEMRKLDGPPACASKCSFIKDGMKKCGDLDDTCLSTCNDTVKTAGWAGLLMSGDADCSCKNPTVKVSVSSAGGAASFGVNLEPSTLVQTLSMLTPLLAIAAQ